MSTSEEEAAPLLPTNGETHNKPTSFLSRLLNEPLSTLSRALLSLCLLLLVISSIFIGLFAGTQHKLNTAPAPTPEWRTVTDTATTTATSVTTSTVISTTIATTTVISTPTPTPTPKPPCTSPECVVLSASILKNLDASADPCYDFYQYSNGGWLAANPLSLDTDSWSVFNETARAVNRDLKRVLAQLPSSFPAADAQSLVKLQDFHASCMNEAALEEHGAKPLFEVVDRIRTLLPDPEPAPVDGTTQNLTPDLTPVLAYLHSIQVNALFSIDIDGSPRNNDPNAMVLQLNPGDSDIPLASGGVHKSYEKLLYYLDHDGEEEELAPWPPWWPWPPEEDKPAPENRTAKADRLSREVVTLETKLSKYLKSSLKPGKPDPYHSVSLEDLAELLPWIYFPSYMSAFAPRTFPSSVVLTNAPYVTKLGKLLSNTSAETIRAYLIVRTAFSLGPHLARGALPVEFDDGIIGKAGSVQDREDVCLSRLQEALGFSLGRFYIMDGLSNSRGEKARELVERLVTAFSATFPTLGWMDKPSASAAARKAAALDVQVGFPTSSPSMLNALAVWRYYARLPIRRDDYFSNILNARASEETKKWAKLGKQRDAKAWELTSPADLELSVGPTWNELRLPSALLRGPFFGAQWPSYLTYGSLGALTSHALVHAFDSEGHLFDEHGMARPWWTNTTEEEFAARRDCLAAQYSEYPLNKKDDPPQFVNGTLTSRESIADAGLILSWRAWKALESSSNEDPIRLPGITLTPEQLFFVAFAQTRREAHRTWAADSETAPGRVRVHGTLRNMPEFAFAFNCSRKSVLNTKPQDRCLVW